MTTKKHFDSRLELRLDEETRYALRMLEKRYPRRSVSEIIRMAIIQYNERPEARRVDD